MTSGVRATTTTVDGAVYHTALPRISEAVYHTSFTTRMDAHDEEKKTEFNFTHNRKSKAELALDVLYY